MYVWLGDPYAKDPGMSTNRHIYVVLGGARPPGNPRNQKQKDLIYVGPEGP